MSAITVSVPRGQTTKEQGVAPPCFSLQLLSLPGVMYFISLVIFPSTDNPLMSVRRPGIALDNGRTKLSGTNSAGEVGSYSPELLPDCPSLEVGLQNIEQENGESDDVDVDKPDHRNCGWRREEKDRPTPEG